jgi:alkanesulfonate monooxygenase SsuD/methylene tetrahydromethanopterin reductase-like flavin-dependent oxidoreductase (luciferase family)
MDMRDAPRFGLVLSNRSSVLAGPATGGVEKLLQRAERAEASSRFDHVWVGDSIMAKPRIESMTLLATIAARTRALRLGVACMASLPSRNPVLLAYQWASLDLLSGGRTILGACMGGGAGEQQHRAEYTNMGIEASERAARLEENVEILRRLWSEERVTHNGRFHQLEGAFVEPAPLQKPPPIWMAGTPVVGRTPEHLRERNLRRVARLGDGWMMTALPVEDFRSFRQQIIDYAPEYDRSFEGRPCCLYYNVNINADPDVALRESKHYLDEYYSMDAPLAYVGGSVAHGPPEACAERLKSFIEAGASDILLRFTAPDEDEQLERAIEELLPLLR